MDYDEEFTFWDEVDYFEQGHNDCEIFHEDIFPRGVGFVYETEEKILDDRDRALDINSWAG